MHQDARTAYVRNRSTVMPVAPKDTAALGCVRYKHKQQLIRGKSNLVVPIDFKERSTDGECLNFSDW